MYLCHKHMQAMLTSSDNRHFNTSPCGHTPVWKCAHGGRYKSSISIHVKNFVLCKTWTGQLIIFELSDVPAGGVTALASGDTLEAAIEALEWQEMVSLN